MREAMLCAARGHHDQHFSAAKLEPVGGGCALRLRMAETTKGRVIFTAGRDLDRFVVWDYIKMRKSIVS